jgi:polyisoprenoid-binding protein YceI
MSRLAVALLVSALALPAAAAPENYTLDPYHTYPGFSIDYMQFGAMSGRFNKSSGKFIVDRAAKTGSVDLIIDTASIDTGDDEKGSRPRSRDEHLRAADFFNVAEFPRMTFKSTKVNFQGDLPASVEGNLTLLGVTKPLTLKFDRFACGDNPIYKKAACGGNAVGAFKRSDFGMKTFVPLLGDEVRLNVWFVGFKD